MKKRIRGSDRKRRGVVESNTLEESLSLIVDFGGGN
jgi:hypothetical protein